MTTKFIKGVINITGLAATALLAWMGWVSIETINNRTETAVNQTQTASAISAMVEIKDKQSSNAMSLLEMKAELDWLVQRSGANPSSLKNIETNVQTSPQN